MSILTCYSTFLNKIPRKQQKTPPDCTLIRGYMDNNIHIIYVFWFTLTISTLFGASNMHTY